MFNSFISLGSSIIVLSIEGNGYYVGSTTYIIVHVGIYEYIYKIY